MTVRTAAQAALVAGLVVAGPQLAARASTWSVIRRTDKFFAKADAALVLGARVWPDGRPSLFLRQRIEVGVSLYERGMVERLIMSGDGIHPHSFDEPSVMTRVAVEMGVPATAITADPCGVDTYSSVHRAAHVYGCSSVIVASQEFHLPRAVWLAQRLGLEAQGAYPPVMLREHTAMGYVREAGATVKAMRDVAQGRVPDGTSFSMPQGVET